MKTIQPTFLLLTFCLLGCTSTHTLRPGHEAGYAALNKHAGRQDAIVTFIDGRKVGVEKLRITPDSTYWTYTNKIATTQINEVQFRRPGSRVKRWSLGHEADQTFLYEKINKQTLGRGVVISLKDGQELRAKKLWLTPAFSYWIDPFKNRQTNATYLAVPTSQIKHVQFVSREKGVGEAMLMGAFIGAVVGFAVGEDCAPDAWICFPREEVAVALGLMSALIAAPIGAVKAHRDIYLIKHEAATGTN